MSPPLFHGVGVTPFPYLLSSAPPSGVPRTRWSFVLETFFLVVFVRDLYYSSSGANKVDYRGETEIRTCAHEHLYLASVLVFFALT